MKKTGIFLVALIFSGALSLNARANTEERSLTLEQAVECAIENNKKLKSSQEDVIYKRKQIMEAISQGLPQVNTTLDYSTNFGYSMNFGPNSVSLDDQLSFSAKVSQLLFNGQWMVGIKTAKIAKKIADETVESTELDVRTNVHNLYYSILAYSEMNVILKKNLVEIQKNLKHTEDMYAAGVVEEVDVDQLRITTSELQNRIFSAERNVELSKNLLKVELGLPMTTNILLTESLEKFISEDSYSQLLANDFDINANISFRQMQTQESLQEKMVSLKKWGFAPTLSANYTYLEKIVSPSFSFSPKNYAGINLVFPIFTGLQRKSAMEMEKINLEKIRINKSLLQDNLNLQDVQCKFNLKTAVENFKLQENNIKVSEKVLKNYQIKYNEGAISSLELTQATTNYLTARTNYTNAVLALLDAQVEIKKLHNNL